MKGKLLKTIVLLLILGIVHMNSYVCYAADDDFPTVQIVHDSLNNH